MRLPTLQKVRMAWGLTWQGSTLPINWRLVIDGMLFVFVMFAVYALVGYIAENASLSARAAQSERQRVKAEQALVSCLNGGVAAVSSDGAAFCERALWVKL